LIVLILEEKDTKIQCFANSILYDSKYLADSFAEYLNYCNLPAETFKIYGILCKIDYPKLEVIKKHSEFITVISDVIEIDDNECYYLNDKKIR